MDLKSVVMDRVLSRTPLAGKVPGGSVVLEIDLGRGLLSNPPETPWAAMKAMNAPVLKVLVEKLREASTDDDVLGLVLYAGSGPVTLAQAQELGDAIARFGQGKPTLAFASGLGELSNDLASYLLATSCQQIWLQPSGQVGIGGVHLGITLAKGMFNKVGVEPEFAKRQEYKTAADQFAADHVTEQNREMMQAIANSLTHDFVETVAGRRKLEHETLWRAMDESPIPPERALEIGLVDRIGYRDEALDHLLQEWAHDKAPLKPEQLRFAHRWSPGGPAGQAVNQLAERRQPTIAVVQVRGGIVTGRGRPPGMGEPETGADVVCEQLRAACRDDKVKAVVLHVDSPGGSAVASDTIWRAVHQVRESGRPVVAQMGHYAASGGYYVSMGADEIVALPATLTGSIGVLAGKLVTLGLYDKLGLVHEAITSGANAGMLAHDSHFTEEQWARLNQWLDRIYDDFTRKAAADRGMEHAQLEPLARGRVWTGRDARERGLVDHLGGLELAVERACDLAKLDRRKVQLKSHAGIGLLDRVRPAQSTEQPTAAALPLGLEPEAVLSGLASRLGIGGGHGVLEVPRISVR
ncbi:MULTISPECIES: signal peptide peptidase SppA [unclassified Luteococcus]|uniref:signal peptide peptidase SppA n=1 Tax=unclassified Luteococcus TaxID=2639923 RepID=UPI00313E0DAF